MDLVRFLWITILNAYGFSMVPVENNPYGFSKVSLKNNPCGFDKVPV